MEIFYYPVDDYCKIKLKVILFQFIIKIVLSHILKNTKLTKVQLLTLTVFKMKQERTINL